jgi:hypothetical protein
MAGRRRFPNEFVRAPRLLGGDVQQLSRIDRRQDRDRRSETRPPYFGERRLAGRRRDDRRGGKAAWFPVEHRSVNR